MTLSAITPSTQEMLAEWTLDKRPIETTVVNTLGVSARNLKGLPTPLVNIVVAYLEKPSPFFIGEREWSASLGRVPRAPAFPLDIENIWQSPCPFFAGKKVSETHMAVYIPKTLNEQPITLMSFGMRVKECFPESSNIDAVWHDLIPSSKAGYRDLWSFDKKDEPIADSVLVLMLKDMLPEGIGNDLSPLPYENPKVLHATICILGMRVIPKINLFETDFARCQDTGASRNSMMVGGVTRTGGTPGIGLRILESYSSSTLAVAPLRQFPL